MLNDHVDSITARSNSRPRILILTSEADDDDVLLLETLRRHAMTVDRVKTADDLNACVGMINYDLIVIDLLIPDTDSLHIVKWLSSYRNLPGIMVRSSLEDDTDRIVVFELGADDFVSKSCNPREVTARIRAILRRRLSEKERHDNLAEGCSCQSSQGKLIFADWVLNSTNRQLLSPSGELLKLSIVEYAILSRLFINPDAVKDRASLVSTSGDGVDLRSADVHVSRLRRKLALYGGQDLIQTVRGQGYRMVAPADAKRR
ncbi:response regulator transcription factor [Sphingomonas sp. T1]|uniref:response regulator transcription factor n=1 Tax=Sphingomonas sp. T1 TaxID=2653172 RepID=UPI00135AB75B|nr:response regulator transcription factor [Sphingomonas sp. T1]